MKVYVVLNINQDDGEMYGDPVVFLKPPLLRDIMKHLDTLAVDKQEANKVYEAWGSMDEDDPNWAENARVTMGPFNVHEVEVEV